jgi:hypothetical protein
VSNARDIESESGQPRVDLPTPTAIWVLGAHLFTLLAPVLLIAVADSARGPLAEMGISAELLMVAAVLLIAGSAFEIGQNTVDNWYFTGVYPARWDFLFQLCITAGSLSIALAAWHNHGWAWLAAGALLLAVPLLYLRRGEAWTAVGIAGLLSVLALYETLGTPVVFLQVIIAGTSNAYFLALITSTHAQSLHGALAFANGAGFLAIPWALLAATDTGGPGWSFVIAIAMILVVCGLVFNPILGKLGATPHRGTLSAQ